MANETPINDLNRALNKILTDYSQEIQTNMGIVIRSTCGKGARELRRESKAKFKGSEYAGGWKSKVEDHRLYTEGTIYNELYSMPHLLEYGHAVIRGGRKVGEAKAHPHIAPVAEKLVSNFEREVKSKL